MTLRATPTPASSREGQSGSILGSQTGTPWGTRSPGSWWSVTATSMPAASSSSHSLAEAMPVSTVTMRSGWQNVRSRSTAACDRP